MIEGLTCTGNLTLLDVMKIINENAKGIAFVEDESHKLIGIITDGDIRRALINGANLNDKISELINTNFIYATKDQSNEEIIEKINNKIKIIPIIDENSKVVDFFELRNDIHVPVASPSLNGNELKYLTDAFLSTWISSTGKYIGIFEENFAKFCDCKYGIATSNGTTALHLALISLGIGIGDEVIVPDLTFAATINSVIYTGATPVIVDIEKDSWCIDPFEIEKAITSKTKAIIPVHLYGQPCDMDKIMTLAKKYNLCVIEDCAEAHGAKFKGEIVGSFGDIGCFSFYGNKVITTGEGGMCVTNSKEVCEKIKVLRDHGMNKSRRYWHDVIGYNYRMTNLQAAIGVAQLERIDEILLERKNLENEYRERLQELHNITFQNNNLLNREKITWLVSILITDGSKEYYVNKLNELGIDIRRFLCSLSEMDLYKKYLFSNSNSRKISNSGINLPTIIGLDTKIIDKIAGAFKNYK